MRPVEIRELRPEEYEEAALLIARAFRDLPTSRACLGDDEATRMRFLLRGYRAMLPVMSGTLLSAWYDDDLVGVTGMQPPGHCRLSPRQMVRLAPFLLFGGRPRQVWRCLRVFLERDRRDPDEPHIHVEPIAISPAAARMGVGKQLGAAVCREADRQGMPIWGITERATTTEYLAQFGVHVCGEFDILGVPNYAVRRDPEPVAAAGDSAAQAVRPPSTTTIAPVT